MVKVKVELSSRVIASRQGTVFSLRTHRDQKSPPVLPERDHVRLRSGLCYRKSVCRL